MVGQHLFNFLFHCVPIFRVYQVQIFFYRWWFATRIKAVNPEQFGRPVIESSRVEGRATRVREALPLSEIKLASLQGFPGTLAIFNVREGSVPSDNFSMLVPKWKTAHQKPAISPVDGATKPRLLV